MKKTKKFFIVLLCFMLLFQDSLIPNLKYTAFAATQEQDTETPTAPSNLESMSITSTSVLLSWAASTDNIGVTSYEIYNGTLLVGSTSGDTTYSVTGLTANTKYNFAVRAKDLAGNLSAPSNVLTLITSAGGVVPGGSDSPPAETTTASAIQASDIEAPSAPSELKTTAVGSDKVDLSWTAATDNVGVTGYEVYNGSQLVGTTTGAVIYSVTNLKANTSYSFTVKAKDAAGNISASNILTIATTPDDSNNPHSETTTPSSIQVPDTEAPTAPTDLKSTDVDSNKIDLSWTASTDNMGVTGYEIYNGNQIAGSTTGSSIHTVTNLTPSTAYSFIVKAKDAAGNVSGASNILEITTDIEDSEAPTIPANLHLVTKSTTSAAIQWDASNDNVGVAGYEIYCDGNKIDTTIETSYTARNLSRDTNYVFSIKAYDAKSNKSDFSSTLSVTTDIDDFGDDFANSTPLKLGVEIQGALDFDRDNDMFSFTPEADGSYVFQTTGNIDTCGVLYDSDGIVLGSGEDWNNSRNFHIRYDLEANKKYYIIVMKSWNDVGSYGISVTAADSTPPTAPQNVLVSSIGPFDVTLSWDASTDNIGVAGYDIYRDGNYIGTSGDTTYFDGWIYQNSTYNYVIKAVDNEGNESEGSTPLSFTFTDNTAPTTPTDLSLVSKTVGSVSIQWIASTDNLGVVGYKIYRDGEYVGYSYESSYTDNNLDSNKTYVYTVKAYDSFENLSEESNSLSVTIDQDIQAPSTPQGLVCTGKAGNFIDLSWNPSTDDGYVAGYEVYCDGNLIGTTSSTTYSATNLEEETSYSFQIKVYDGAGNKSDFSSALEVTTPHDPGSDFSTSDALQLGVEVQEAIDYPGDVDMFSFTPAVNCTYSIQTTGNIDTYGYLYDSNGNLLTYNDDSNGSGNFCIKYNLISNQKYFIKVRHYNSSSTGEYGIKITASDSQPPTAPSNLVLASKTSSSVTIQWTASNDNVGVAGYKIYRNGSYLNDSSTTGFTDENLDSSTIYIYKVKAFDAVGNLSSESSSLSVYMGVDNQPPTVPTGLSVTSKTAYTINLSWTASSDNVGMSGYEVYCNGNKIDNTSSITYSAANLTPNTNYSFSVKAYDADGNKSDLSDALAVTTYNDDYGDDFNHSTSLQLNVITQGSINYQQDVDMFDFIPLASGEYKFEGSGNTTLTEYIYNSNGVQLTSGYNVRYTFAANTKYYIKVQSYSSNSTGTYGIKVRPRDTEPPTAPQNVSVASATGTGVNLTWDASTDNVGVTFYYIYRDGNNIGGTGSTNFTDAYVTLNSTYSYVIKAIDADNNYSSGSTPLSFTVPNNIAMNIPSGLNYSSKTGYTINLTWNYTNGIFSIAGYEIYCNNVKIGTSQTKAYSATGLTPNTSYVFTVKAYDALGNKSDFSSPLTITTYNDEYGDDTSTATALQENTAISGVINYTSDKEVFSFTPSSTSKYVLEFPNTTYLSWTFADSNGNVLLQNTTDTLTGKKYITAQALAQNQTYYLTVLYNYYNYYNYGGRYSLKMRSLDANPPTAPADLNLVSKTPESASIQWAAAIDNVGVAGYKIYRDGNYVGDSTQTSFNDTHLASNTTYEYTVKAYDAEGNLSDASNSLSVTIDTDSEAPTVPSGLICTSKTLNSLSLSWSASTDNARVAGYEIYCNGDKIGTSSSTTYIANGLTQNTSYIFAIKAYDSSGNKSDYSSSITVTTYTDDYGNDTSNSTTLQLGTELKGAINYPGDADMFDFTPVVNGYYAIKSTGTIDTYGYLYDSNGVQLASDDDSTGYRNFLINYNLVANTKYYIKVRHFNSNGTGAYGIILSKIDTQPPTAPQNLAVTLITKNSVTLSWSPSTDNVGVTGYKVYRDGNLIGSSSGTTYTDSTVVINTTYSYVVKAYDQMGNLSDGSAALSVTFSDNIPPTAPTNISMISKTLTSATIQWDASTDNIGVTGYKIFRDGNYLSDCNQISYTDNTVKPGTSYVYTIKAFDSFGNLSDASSTLNITTDVDSAAPSIPVGLNCTSKTGYVINLSWTASTDNARVAGYDIYCNGNKIGTSTTTTYSAINLTPNTNYAFSLKAYDESGNKSDLSTQVIVSTYNDDCGDDFSTARQIQINNTVPGAINYASEVDYFSFTPTVSGKYILEFPSSDDVHSVVYDSNHSQLTKNYNNYNYNSCYITLSENQVYYLKISYYSNYSYASYNIKISGPDMSQPTAPTNLTTTSKNLTSIAFSWTASSDNIALVGYNIYRNGTKINYTINTSYTDSGLIPNTTYNYVVKAYDKAGNESDGSNILSETTVVDNTPPSVPNNFRMTSRTGSNIRFAWGAATDDSGINRYDLYRNDVKITSISRSSDSDRYGYSYNDSSIQPGVYSYVLKAVDLSGNVSASSNVIAYDNTDQSVPHAPQNLVLTSKALPNIIISWTAPDNANRVVNYVVYRNGNYLGTTSALTYTDTNNITVNTTYNYTVKAYDENTHYSDASNTLTVTTDVDTEPPTVPVNVSVYDKGTNYIGISWNSSSDNLRVKGYQIFRDGVQIGTKDANSYYNYGYYRYSDNNLAPGLYTYTVKAYDESGNVSQESSQLQVPLQITVTPINLTVQSKTAGSVTLHWDADLNCRGYYVYRDNKYIQHIYVTNFTDTGLKPNTTYSYKITGDYAANGYSLSNNALTVTTNIDNQAPSIPINLTVSSKNGSSITLGWSASTDDVGVQGYEVYRDGAIIGRTASTNYLDAGLTELTQYRYKIKVYDASGNISDFSNEIIAVPIMPHISRMEPDEGGAIGGAGLKRLSGYFLSGGSTSGYTGVFQYSTDGVNWSDINTVNNAVGYDSQTSYLYTDWDITNISTGNYKIKFTLKDAYNNTDTRTINCYIDRTPPQTTQNFIVTPDLGVINLSWDIAVDSYAAGYKIYRCNSINGNYSLLSTISQLSTNNYTDIAVQASTTYYYKITTVDRFGQESAATAVQSAAPITDNIQPVILGISPVEGTAVSATASITVRAQDNLAIDSITLQYFDAESSNWINISTANSQDTAVFTWNTAAFNGDMKIRAIAKDKAGNVSDGTPVRTLHVDNQGPEKVNGLHGSAKSTSILLNWNDISDSDFGYFLVEEKDSVSGNYQSIGTVSDKLGMKVTGLQSNKAYWFKVTAYDKLGNRGISSDEYTISTLLDTTAPVVTALQPTPGRFGNSIPLVATISDNVGAVSATIQSSRDGVNWTDLTTVTTTETPVTTASYNMNVSTLEEGTWYFRVIARDEVGNTSNSTSSAPFVQYYIDHIAPAIPTGLKTTSDVSNITLSWNAGSDTDLAVYKIYRKAENENSFTLIKDNYTYISYQDNDVKPDVNYSYKISAVDSAGNEGQATDVVTSKLLPDTEAPVIYSISEASGTTLPANPTINILVGDNYKVSKITMEYQLSGDTSNAWTSIDSAALNAKNGVVSINWNTTGLTEGSYNVRFTAVDSVGNKSALTAMNLKLKLNPPAVPVVTVVPGGWAVNLSWTSGNDNDLAGYRVYRSTTPGGKYQLVKEITGTTYVDTPITPGISYYYKVQAVDKYRNSSFSTEVVTVPTDEDPYPPIVEAGDDQTAIQGVSIFFDGFLSEDNNRIASYSWDFGDGSSDSAAQPVHTYAAAGTYTVTLTVKDPAGNTSIDTCKVFVYPPTQVGTLEIKVLDEATGIAIPYASVYIDFPDNTPKNYTANANGIVKVVTSAGNYNICAYANKYMPKEVNTKVEQYKTTTQTIRLPKGEVVVGDFQVRRMPLDEIIAAGIDVNQPENQYVYKFEVHLEFNQQPLPVVNYYVNGNGGLVGNYKPISFGGGGGTPNGGGGGYNGIIYPVAVGINNHPEVPPTMAYLVIPQQVSWLKEFFEVSLIMKNMADPQFEIVNSSVTLNIPEGLSLAPTKIPQTLTKDIGTIAGGESKEVKWIIRGDVKGEYHLSANFNGTIMPFVEPVKATFRTSEPIKVWAGDALHIYVMPEDAAYIGEQYYVQFVLKNESDHPVYNIKTSFGAYEEPIPREEITVIDTNGNETKVINGEVVGDETIATGMEYVVETADSQASLPSMYPGDSMIVNQLLPGECIYGTYVTGFSAPGDPEKVYYTLEKSFVVDTGGNATIPVTIMSIPSHISKYFVQEIDLSSPWADPVDTTTGANIIDEEVISVSGATDLSFDISYNSLLLKEGTLGKGWSHNYETRIEKCKDESILVYWSPSSYTRFFRKDVLNNRTYGTIIGNGSIKVSSGSIPIAQEYYSKVQGMKDYLLKRNEDGRYILTCGNKNKYYFDSEGKMNKLEDKYGNYIFINRDSEGRLTITEPISGQKLIVSYNAQGLVDNVTDLLDRKVSFQYDLNKCLTKIIDAEGKGTIYTYDAEGHVLTAKDAEGITYMTNTYDGKGRVIAQDDGLSGNGLTKFSYDDTSEYWRTIVTITDRNGNTRKHVSNRLGQVLRIEDELGNTTINTYDAQGNRTSVKDPNGNITIYTYDDRGNPLTVSDAEGTKTTMTYDSSDNLLTVHNANGENITNIYDSNNRVKSTTDQTRKKTTYTYNNDGQVERKTVEGVGEINYTYEKGKLKTVSDYLGNITTYSYDLVGRLVSVTDREGNTASTSYDKNDNIISETDAEGYTVTYTYDSRGNKLTETDERDNIVRSRYNGNGKLVEVTDALGNKTTYEYDGEDRVTKVTDSEGNASGTEYDAAGRVTSTTDAKGNKTSFTYDKVGDILTVTKPGKGVIRYTYYKNGKLKSVTDEEGSTTTYYYDAAWRIKATENVAGKTTTFTYDASGNLLSETDPLGNKTSYTYDARGNRLTVTDARGNVTKFEYSSNDELVKVTDALGNKTEYQYDKEDRLVKTIDAKGNSQDISYNKVGKVHTVTDALGNTVTFEYDSSGNLVGVIDADGNQIHTTSYDQLNRPITVTDAVGNITTSKYDSVGRLIEILDELNRITKINYDEMNRPISVVDPLSGESKQEFDEDGKLKSITDPNHNQQSFKYDLAGRLISETTAIGSEKTYGYNSLGLLEKMKNGRGQEATYECDDAGNLTGFTDVDGAVSYTYDANGNITVVSDDKGTIKREYDVLNRVTKYTDCSGNEIKYSYDTVGNLIALTYPGGKIVRYEYDAANRLIKVTDWNNRLTAYQYNKNGLLVKTTRPDGTEQTQTYDKASKLIQVKDVDKTGNVINQYDYEYDKVGNVTVEKSSANKQPYAGKNAVMTYDKGNRLLTYNGQTVEYDADGNMTYGPLNGKMVHFTYDSRNRLITAGDTSYIHDVENNRIAVIENGVRRDYVNDPQAELSQLLMSKDSEGNITYYIYGIGLLAQEESDGSYKTYHFDLRGSTTAITDISGKVTDRIDYGPYGELVKKTGTTKTPFLFNGRDGVMTDNNGLYYMRARYYNPDIKRFINQDILQGDIFNGISLNRFAYANGNPISMVDPFGLSPSSIIHSILDDIGWIPVIGDAADAVNAAWYLFEGDYLNAGLSSISVIPYIGSGVSKAAKWGGRAFKSSKVGGEVIRWAGRGTDYAKNVARNIVQNVNRFREAWRATKPSGKSIKLGSNFGNVIDDAYERLVQVKKKLKNLDEVGGKAAEWSSEKGIYSVAYEVKLPENLYPSMSSPRHFQEANRQLYEAFQKDQRFAQQMEELYPGIIEGVQPGKRGAFSRKPPTNDITWHHHPEREGVMQLIPLDQHTASGKIQSILHPNRKGGMENWGGGR